MDTISSPPKKKIRRDKSAQVTLPNVQDGPVTTRSSGTRIRSNESLIQRDLEMTRRKLQLFMTEATIITLPWTLDELKTQNDIQQLEKICAETLGPNTPSQCLSARFVDPNSNTLLAYFANRISQPKYFKAIPIDLKDQYSSRTTDFLENIRNDPKQKECMIINDGLSPNQCEMYQLASQALCSALPLHSRFDTTRHQGENVMLFQSEIETPPSRTENDEVNAEAYELLDEASEKKEQAGVVHLVHGWPQQGQARSKGLFISGDMSHTSTSLAAAGSYYYLTESIAAHLAEMFRVVFPKEYNKYDKAFQAGVWMQCDPGPYLGRAIIYKLQGRLHKDRHDLGPSASFGVGQYTGGEMLFPQLGTKLSYDPGHVCIFYSSVIYHKVSNFVPTVQTAADAVKNITPGRIGSVFFFPKESYNILCDKKPGWGYKTAFGRSEGLILKRYLEMDESEEEYESEESM